MAARHDGQKGSSGTGKTRGSVRNSDRLEAFSQRNGNGGADWAACDPARLQAVVVAITALGGAVTFGLSRDQGAHSLTLMLDNSRETMWYNGDAVLDNELKMVQGHLDALT